MSNVVSILDHLHKQGDRILAEGLAEMKRVREQIEQQIEECDHAKIITETNRKRRQTRKRTLKLSEVRSKEENIPT